MDKIEGQGPRLQKLEVFLSGMFDQAMRSGPDQKKYRNTAKKLLEFVVQSLKTSEPKSKRLSEQDYKSVLFKASTVYEASRVIGANSDDFKNVVEQLKNELESEKGDFQDHTEYMVLAV